MIISFSSLIILPNIVFRKKKLIIIILLYYLTFITLFLYHFRKKKKTHHLPHFKFRTKIPDIPGLDPIRWLPQGGRDGVGALSDG